MRARPPAGHLRAWLAAALLAIVAAPPLVVWTVYAAWGQSVTSPGAATVAAGRSYAITSVTRWDDPAWQRSARGYFAARHINAQLRPASGPWFTTGPAEPAGGVPAPSKFIARGPGHPGTILGSGWVVPVRGIHTGWALPLAAGGAALALTVAAAGIFLGREVVRPLAAMSRAAAAVPHGELGLHLPPTRVREVADVAAALTTMSTGLRASLDQQADMEEQRRLFIGAIAHDLRTPLFILRGYLDGLSDGLATSPESTARYLTMCRTAAATLDQLISGLFTYARMEFLGEQPHTRPLDLAALLRDTAQAHRTQAAAKGITLTATASPCPLTADEHLLTRVIGNLLDNALRHTPPGGRVEAACVQSSGHAILTVTDTGPGIAAADLPHLFTPRFRGGTPADRTTSGAGLGLAIAHRIIQAHHGTLTAENTTPHGARFTVRIPASEAGDH